MIPQDKIGHLKAGAAAAVAGALLGAGAGHVLDLPLEALAATCAGSPASSLASPKRRRTGWTTRPILECTALIRSTHWLRPFLGSRLSWLLW